MKKLLVLILGIVLIAGVLSGCTEEEDDNGGETDENNAPTINGDITYEPENITVGEDITFTVNASDIDEDELTYTWMITNETGWNITETTTVGEMMYNFTADGNFSNQTCTVKVEVTDGEETVTKEITIEVELAEE